MTEKIFEPRVSSMYSKYPFPKRNQFGIDKMNQDFKENLNKLGLDISDFKTKKSWMPDAALENWLCLWRDPGRW